MTTRHNYPSAPIKIALLAFGFLVLVSLLICWLTGFVTKQAVGLCLMGSGIMAILFAAYGFMGETAMDCDEGIRFSRTKTPAMNQNMTVSSEDLCVNHLALGIGAGGVLTIITGILVFMLV